MSKGSGKSSRSMNEAAADVSTPICQLVILRNEHGVEIREDHKPHGHYEAVGAQCCCGMELMVAPALFHADHQKGDPVMVCGDHGVHAYRFKYLVPGKQPEPAR
jgi:hypothetical protein